MTVQTGRTVPDFEKLYLGAASGSMVDMKIKTRTEVGFTRRKYDVTSMSDLGGGTLPGTYENFTLTFTGPIDNTATTGPSTLMRTWAAAATLLSFDLQQGVRHAWENGEQQFGLSATVATNSGVYISEYKEGNDGMYSCTIEMTAGSAVWPAWGTAAEIVPA